jgi:uncharacterized delta-60 repeat protein
MRNSKLFTITAAALFALGTIVRLTPALAAAGALDPTFGSGGTVTTVFSSSVIPADVALQADGKILVAAGFDNVSIATEAFGVVRYNANGSLDTAFGTKGRALTSFTNFINSPAAMALQSDGKIIVVGNATSADGKLSEFAIARWNTNGTLDSSFGSGGKVTTNFVGVMTGGVSNPATAVILQGDGKIIVAGVASQAARLPHLTALARYLSNGSLDSSFGTGGTTSVAAIGAPTSLALGQNGDIFTLGANCGVPIVEFTPTGSLDNGVIPEAILATSSNGASAFQADGRFVVAGSSGPISDVEIKATRFNIDGAVDGTFFNVPFNLGTPAGQTSSSVQGVGFQSNGQVILGGAFSTNTNSIFGIARLNSDGSLDSGFGNGGTVTTSFMNSDLVNAVAVQSNEDIVAVGTTLNKTTGNTQLALARYLGH